MSKVCVVVGIGPGNGLALTRRFVRAGYAVAMLSRSAEALAGYAEEIEGAHAFACDATDPEAVAATIAAVEEQLGPVDTLIYNAGSGTFGELADVTAGDLTRSWKVNTLGLFLLAKSVTPGMIARGDGRIAVIGASAAWRGRARTHVFASAKAAQRSLSQSLARELGPKGIHVLYVVLDGVIDLPKTREAMPDKPDEFFLQPDAIATAVHGVLQQPRSAWTFELDLRPHIERW
jgi:NAD(P)-dependent dehydrogenase (short-subunit alcohol dehydrogenase family)